MQLRQLLRSALASNLNLKIVSFASALALYSLVHGGHDARRSIVVDLEARLPPESSNRILKGSGIPPSVRLFVRGSSTTIDDLRASGISLQLDLSSGEVSHVAFEPKMVRFPAGVVVDIEHFEPPGLDLEWDERIVRDVPVQVSVVGSPAVGYVVKGAPVAEPSSVRIRGPQSEVVVLQHVRANAFDVTGLAEGAYPRQLGIERLPVRLVAEPGSVIVTANVTREVAERPFTKLPVAVIGNVKARVQPAEVDVRMVCPPDLVRSLRPEQVVPRVELTSKDPSGSVELPVSVKLESCEAHPTPETVIVRW